MFPIKFNSINKSKNLIASLNENYQYLQVRKISVYLRNVNSETHHNRQNIYYTKNLIVHNSKTCWFKYTRHLLSLDVEKSYCTWRKPKNSDVFGDIGYSRYEEVKLDEDEETEEKFIDNEFRVPRRLKLSPGQYGALIKSHIGRGDLISAINVLDLIKKNRDKPTTYMYNLLLRALSIQGDLKLCFKLFNNMKKQALKPDDATYTCLLNVCATSDKSENALKHLLQLRQYFFENNYPLNETHYNCMIKAYAWQNKLPEAFKIADEMRDKKIPITQTTYSSLFHAAISDKEAGIYHALKIWHMMIHLKIPKNLIIYNLLLRAIRDTKLGNLNLNNSLIDGVKSTTLCFNEETRPDLLASPPVFNNVPQIMKIKECEENPNLDNKADQIEKNSSELIQSIDLNQILVTNRLILFGGLENILRRMEQENIIPDVKTLTLALELAPSTKSVEEYLIKYAHKKKIELDIDFFNILIKRRSMRSDYENAKDVLRIIQQSNLTPNIMTFGVLALACPTLKEGQELLDSMEKLNYSPNAVVVGTLLKNACIRKDHLYVIRLINYIIFNQIKPSKEIINTIEVFNKVVTNYVKNKHKYKFVNAKFEKEFKKFKEKYSGWEKYITNFSNKQ